MFAGGNPVLLGAGVDLEDVRSAAEDGLLSAGHTDTPLQCMMGKHNPPSDQLSTSAPIRAQIRTRAGLYRIFRAE